MFHKPKNDIQLILPLDWKTVPIPQLLTLFALSLVEQNTDNQILAIRLFLSARQNQRISNDELQPYASTMDWIYKKPILQLPTDSLKLYHQKWTIRYTRRLMGDLPVPIPFLSQRFYLPKKLFEDVTMEEMVFGSAHFINYVNTKEASHLIKALATFIRPRQSLWSRKKRPYRKEESKLYESYFEELPALLQLLLFRYLSDNLAALTELRKFRILFPKKEEQNNPEPTRSTVWLDFALDAAGLPNLGGDVDKLMKKNIHIVLSAVAEHRREQNRMAREMAANK